MIFEGPPFIYLTPTDFNSKCADLFTSSFILAAAFFKLFLYPAVLSVFRGRFEGMSKVIADIARSNMTFALSIAI